MFIREKYQSKRPVLSFEIFPPKKDLALQSIFDTIEALTVLRPDFISVTYGAGGSTKDKTIEIASIIQQNYGIDALAHLTCISSTKDQIQEIVKSLEQNEIRNILALRGDFPNDPNFVFPTPLHYEHASDLIAELKARGNFCVGGAYYPEGHIESPDLDTDLRFLKLKVDTGLDFLISQLFFENQAFYAYQRRWLPDDRGIVIPYSAGIMPVQSKTQIERMTALAGCSIPPQLKKLLEMHENSPEELKAAGLKYAIEQIRDLIAHGVGGIHIYTMNKPQIAIAIVKEIRDLL